MSQTNAPNRVEITPDQFCRPHGLSAPISVTLPPNQEVQWTWMLTPDGQQYVSGYIIKEKKNKGTL